MPDGTEARFFVLFFYPFNSTRWVSDRVPVSPAEQILVFSLRALVGRRNAAPRTSIQTIQVAAPATSGEYRALLPWHRWGIEETAMRKVLVAPMAIGRIALAGDLIAALKTASDGRQAPAAAGLGIFDLS